MTPPLIPERMAEVTSSQADVVTTSAAAMLSGNLTNVWERYGQEELYFAFRPAIMHVDKYVTPLWYIIGFPSNLIAFTIWIRPRMRPSSGCYLAALAMSDFIFLILQLIYELQSTWDVRLLKLPVLCEGFPVFFLASQYMSPVLVLGFTVEKYISICHPFKREKLCTTSRTIKVIVSIVICSLVLHSVQAYFWHYGAEKDECTVREEVTRGGMRSIWSVWSWVTELLVFGLVPLAILFLNLLVICEIRRLTRSEKTRLCLKQTNKSSAATVTLLAVSFYLIFTTLPVTICYTLFLRFPEGSADMTDAEITADPTWQRHFAYYSFKTIIEELGMSHYACNFFIYLSTGKLFRKELRDVFLKTFKKDSYRSGNTWSTRPLAHSYVRTSRREDNGDVAHL